MIWVREEGLMVVDPPPVAADSNKADSADVDTDHNWMMALVAAVVVWWARNPQDNHTHRLIVYLEEANIIL